MDYFGLITEVLANLLVSILYSEFLIRYLGFKKQQKYKKILSFALCVIFFISIILCEKFIASETMRSVVYILVMFVYTLLVLEGTILEKAFVVVTEHGVDAVSSFFTILSLNLFFPYDMPTLVFGYGQAIRIIGIVCSKLIFWIITRLLLKFKRVTGDIKNKQWIVLISTVVLSYMTMLVIMEMTVFSDASRVHRTNMFINIIVIFVMNTTIFMFTSYINNNNKMTLENTLLKQSKFYEEQNAGNINKIYGETKILRHDMKYHVQYLLSEINSMPLDKLHDPQCKEHIDNISAYINHLNFELINLSTVFIDTGNNALTNILNYKISAAKKSGIEIIPDIIYQITAIDDIDIIILIGNLIDNAIEECEKIKTDDKKIFIKITKGKYYLNISVKNPIGKSVLENNPNFISTKEELAIHGMGIKSIKNIVEKYDGLINYNEEDNHIIVEIMLVENENTA